ncbi:hypothetical protein WMY93_008593 [Mugilogobius chulae]|uniref:C2H2-type domain-containing protein n=1 Tax=Mugilogobius chulae TaxID=88201 RepID=A0AAW0PGQ4_9GOBI
MAAVELPDSAKAENSSLDQQEPMDTPPSADSPVSDNTDFFLQKDETTTDERTDSIESGPKSSATSVVAAADSAVTAHSEDNVQPKAEADSTTGNLPENHKPKTEKEPNEVQSLLWSESEDNTEEAQEDINSKQESVGKGNCSTKMTSEVCEAEFNQPENSQEKKSTEEETSVEQKEEADGKGEEADPEEDMELTTKQIKRRMMCKECGKTFNRRETFNLHRHFHLHEDELKPLTCKDVVLPFSSAVASLNIEMSIKKKRQNALM